MDEWNSGIGGGNNNVNYSIEVYKTSITGKLEDTDRTKDVKIIAPLKYLNNFWRTLDVPLINCSISLILTWAENCLLTSKETRDANPNVNPAIAAVNNLKNVKFEITDTKLYVPVVTLSTKDDNIFKNNWNQGLK